MREMSGTITRSLVALAALAALSACTDEKIVYQDVPNYEQPASAAANFVGYQNETSKETACGSCHVEVAGMWKETKHANAWATLQANAGKKGYCEACHTVNNNGNAKTDTLAGWRTTKSAKYQDVQCEACHGAGLTHISSPTKSNVPLVSIKASLRLQQRMRQLPLRRAQPVHRRVEALRARHDGVVQELGVARAGRLGLLPGLSHRSGRAQELGHCGAHQLQGKEQGPGRHAHRSPAASATIRTARPTRRSCGSRSTSTTPSRTCA